ncbi:MAG TPA: Rieske 2Fe-2S domain-containing protein [Gemmatimonadaceae bacterium]|nr:Rieske 2Fe-2S domain-containing protein [Gemmatimonadaceae bacterium]
MTAIDSGPGPHGHSGEFEVVASLSDLAEGKLLQRVRSAGDAICLVRQNGRISAVSDICTHQHFSMSHGELLPDGTIECAWHGARFDCQTGEVRQVPAISPLPVFEVRLQGESVLVGPRCARVNGAYAPGFATVP